MDKNYEQKHFSRSATGIYKIGYDSIRLMKLLSQKQYYNNIIYYDLLASVLYALTIINFT